MEKARPIQLQAIDHIVLRVVDLPKMLAFYCDILGCVVEREVAEFGLTQLRAGSALIDLVTVDSKLGQQGGRAPEQEGRNLDHFCLQITPKDEQEILDFLTLHGCRWKISPIAMAHKGLAVPFISPILRAIRLS